MGIHNKFLSGVCYTIICERDIHPGYRGDTHGWAGPVFNLGHSAFYVLLDYGVFTALLSKKLPLPAAVVSSSKDRIGIVSMIERICLTP